MTIFSKLLRLAPLPLAAVLGFTLGACSEHGDYRINKVCKNYCQRVLDCNDNTDYEMCIDDCVDEANSCESDDDVASALDILEDCTGSACNQVGGCTVEAWIECNL